MDEGKYDLRKESRGLPGVPVVRTLYFNYKGHQEWRSKHEAVAVTSGGSRRLAVSPSILRVRRDKLRR